MELLPSIEASWRVGKKQSVIPTLGWTGRVNIFVTLFWPCRNAVWNVFKRRRNIEFRQHLSNVVAYAKRHRLRRVILFIDHASYHKTPQVKKFIEAHSEILRVKFLGKHDPNSNPTESLVNKRLHSAVCVNRSHPSIKELRNAARKFMRKYNLTYAT